MEGKDTRKKGCKNDRIQEDKDDMIGRYEDTRMIGF